MGVSVSSLGRSRPESNLERDVYPSPAAQSQLSVEQIRDMIARGIRPDLSLLPFQMPRMKVDGIPPPPIETNAKRIRNDVNLRKTSIRLIPAGSSSCFHIALSFDAIVPCVVSVYFAAVDEDDQLRLPSLILGIQRSPSVGCFGAGVDQTFQTQESFDLSILPPSSLTYTPYSKSYPLAIRLAAEDADTSKNYSGVKSQTSYCTFIKQGDSYIAKVMKQAVEVGGRHFEIEEIYGLESAECVICMSAPRNTALLPCKHCVVCSQCADILRVQTAKCPICRSAVFKLLKIGSD